MKELTRTVTLVMEDSTTIIKIFSIIFVLTAIDLLSKYLFLQSLGFQDISVPFIVGYFDWFVTPHAGHSFEPFMSDYKNHLFSIIATFFLIFLFAYGLFFKIKKVAVFCIILIVSGGFSNMFDKMYNYNATNIICSIQQSSGYQSACFNLADIYVLIGITVGFIVNAYYFSTHFIDKTHMRFFVLLPFLIGTPLVSFNWLIHSF
jgi:lipoprotein signal peptidase